MRKPRGSGPGLRGHLAMPCYKPLDCWRQPGALKPGEKRIVFSKHDGDAKAMTLACGQCVGCRLERSRRWAVRIMHEASLHESSCFLTLTYSDEHVPSNGSLDVRDFQLFMKRLRRGSSGPLRFFHCGEYGEITSRPHYHVCLFGTDFRSDRFLFKHSRTGHPVYISPELSALWPLGYANIGELTFESAAYVARYCLKKLTASDKSTPEALAHFYERYGAYCSVDTREELFLRTPEYVTMSRRPGIGHGWFEKFSSEVYPSDSVVMRGKEMMPPPFYDKLLEKVDPGLFSKVKRERSKAIEASAWSEDSRSTRLLVREEVKVRTVTSCLKRE